LPQEPQSIATGDLNEDGKLDLVVTSITTLVECPYECETTINGYVNVLLGNGSGGFGVSATVPLGMDRIPTAVAVGDIDDDGHADVITSDRWDGLSVLLGNGSGGFGSPITSGFGSAGHSISLGDVDGDGDLDSLSINGFGVNLQKGDGTGSFTTQPSLNLNHPIESAMMGDVNGDGNLDLVAAGANNWFTCTSGEPYPDSCIDGYWSTNRRVIVLLGDGEGQFSLPLTSDFGGGLGTSLIADVGLADLTGDSLPEIITIDQNRNVANVAINDGNWKLPPTIAISDAAVVEGNSGARNAIFTVTITGEHGEVSVGVSTSAGTSTAGSDFTAVSETLTFFPSEFTKTIAVPVLGDTLYEGNEEFVVFLSRLSGEIAFIDSQGVGTIQEDDPAPLLTISDVAQNEGNQGIPVFSFVVQLSAPSGNWVYFDFATSDGTATLADNDYHFRGEFEASIEPGQTSTTLTVEVVDDTMNESNETFFIDLWNVKGATLADAQGSGTIVNDDATVPSPQPTMSIGDAKVIEGNSGTRQMTFTVSLSRSSGQEVRVHYATANGTATTGNDDYLAKSGMIIFSPGQTTKTITITIKGDKKVEQNEQFSVRLSGAKNGTIGDGQGVGTILNDDGASAGRYSFARAVDAAIDSFLASRLKRRGR
jgi:hypothetical protein